MEIVENQHNCWISLLTSRTDQFEAGTAAVTTMNHQESVSTSTALAAAETACLQLTNGSTTNESSSNFVQPGIKVDHCAIDAIGLDKRVEVLKEERSSSSSEDPEEDPWYPFVPLVPVKNRGGSIFEDGDFGTLTAEQVMALQKLKMELQVEIENDTETDNFLDWICCSTSSERTGSSFTDVDRDLIDLDDVHIYKILEPKDGDAVACFPLEGKIEEVGTIAGAPPEQTIEVAFVDVPVRENTELEEEIQEYGVSEIQENEVYEVDDEMLLKYPEPKTTYSEAYALVEETYMLKHGRAKMEREEGHSLKKVSWADEDPEQSLENISYEVAAAVLDSADTEDTSLNLECQPHLESSVTISSHNKAAEQDLKCSEEPLVPEIYNPVNQPKSEAVMGKRRHRNKKQLSVTFAPKCVIINNEEHDPNKRTAANGESRATETKNGKNALNVRKNGKEIEVIPKAKVPKAELVGPLEEDTTAAESVDTYSSHLKPLPEATGSTKEDQKSYLKPTIYADFENPELARLVKKQRQRDLENATGNRQQSPPHINAPHERNNFLKRVYSDDGNGVRKTKTYFPTAPPPLNNIYNVPKTGIQRWQEMVEKNKKNKRGGSKSAKAAAVETAHASAKQQAEIPSLMSLNVSPPPGHTDKHKSKKKASKAKGPDDKPKQTGRSPAVLESLDEDNAGVKSTEEPLVVTRSSEVTLKRRNQANFNNIPVQPVSAEPTVVWTGHPTSSSTKSVLEPKAKQLTSASLVPNSPVASSTKAARLKGFPECDFGDLKEPVRILSSDELSDALSEGRQVQYFSRKMTPRRSKLTKTINIKPAGGGKLVLNNRLLEAFSSSSDSSLSESSATSRPKPYPIEHGRSKMHQKKPDETEKEVATHFKVENKRVLELRKSESKIPSLPRVIVKEEARKMEGHKCLFKRCKAKVGSLVMNQEDAVVAMKDHLWRNHRVKIDKGEGGLFILAWNLEKLIEKLKDSVKGTTEVISLLKHGELFFAVKAGVGPDDVLYYELVYLKHDHNVKIQEDIFVQHGFEIINGEERDMELREMPVAVWDPSNPVRDNPDSIKSITVADLKDNFLFDGFIRMGFKVFTTYTDTKAKTSAHLHEEEIDDQDTDMLEAQEYVQRCKDSTFFGKPSASFR